VCLDAFDRINNADSAVKDGKTSINLESEVLMAGCVNQVDRFGMSARGTVLSLGPVESDGCRLNRDSPFSLQFQKVGDGVSSINI
jgi:hypothetical protein